jgi:hypothetical protein
VKTSRNHDEGDHVDCCGDFCGAVSTVGNSNGQAGDSVGTANSSYTYVPFTCSNSSFSLVLNQNVAMEHGRTERAGVTVISIRPALLVSTQFKMITTTAPAKVGFSQHVNLAFRC